MIHLYFLNENWKIRTSRKDMKKVKPNSLMRCMPQYASREEKRVAWKI